MFIHALTGRRCWRQRTEPARTRGTIIFMLAINSVKSGPTWSAPRRSQLRRHWLTEATVSALFPVARRCRVVVVVTIIAVLTVRGNLVVRGVVP
uniref:Uncharacterized protein n=1 Tax=Trichuris muris TaxID=70415 RepID=A0A5S6QED7_TRIMR